MPNEVNIDTTLKTNWNVTILSAIIAALAGVLGSYFLYKSDLVQADVSRESISTERFNKFVDSQLITIAALKKDMANAELKFEAKINKLIAENERLTELYLAEKLSSFEKDLIIKQIKIDLETYRRFNEDIPFAGWIKCQDPSDGTFRFIALNDKFTQYFGLTQFFALNKNDYEVFPDNPELAKAYQEGDLQVATTGIQFRSELNVPDAEGNLILSDYIKFRMKTIEDRLCVGGVIIDKKEST